MSNEPKHTATPWTAVEHDVIQNAGKSIINNELNKTICTAYTSRSWNMSLEEGKANADRIVACVNACNGLDNPEQWIWDAQSILMKLSDFEHPELDSGDSKINALIHFAKERDALKKWNNLISKESDQQLESLRAVNAELIEALRDIQYKSLERSEAYKIAQTTLAKYEKP